MADGATFDAVAGEYDAAFTERRLGRWLRAAVWEHLADTVEAGDRVLDLGCGTGEDAVWLARRGVHVTAVDASAAMLAQARQKARRAGADEALEFVCLDLRDAEQLTAFAGDTRRKSPYDIVFSNFGALNCLPDRRSLADALQRLVRPGGRATFVVMGPLCPWEITWHLAHGDVDSAFRRFRAGVPAHAGRGRHLRVWYPSPRRLRREFAPAFRHVYTVGIGALLPPSYLDHLVERRPRLFSALAQLERYLAGVFPLTWLNDHYLSSFERPS